MKFYALEPEVTGELHEGTKIDNSTHPPIISDLHLNLNGWLGDDVFECFPVYIVTERLMMLLGSSVLSGFTFENFVIEFSEEFHDMYPGRKVPKFYWLKVIGKPGIDDFALSTESLLIISENAYSSMIHCKLDNCEAVEWKVKE